MRLLTFKTVFLIAIATARRVSGIHAISGLASDILFASRNSSVTLNFLPEFRAKNQAVQDLNRPLTIPGLKALLCPEDADRLLCPIRALLYYLDRTKDHRQDKRRLFLSLNSKHKKDIQKGTIARWIRTLIHLAYSQCASSLTPISTRAHETRAIASSMAVALGASLENVMRTAYWKSQTTFLHHYLRDVSQQSLDNSFSLGQVVFAGYQA